MLDVTRAYGLDFRFPLRDEVVGAALKHAGEFGRPEMELLAAYMADAGTLIDVGANIGAISLPLARKRPDWRVLGFEAHRGLAAIYAANAFSNGLFNVEPFHAAVGAAQGIAEFPTPPLTTKANFGETGFSTAEAPKEPVLLLPLDAVAPPDTRIVKVDVEGYEGEVFKGAAALIQRGATWLFEWKAPDIAGPHIELFKSAGYGLFWFFAPFITPENEKRLATDKIRGDWNILALRGGENLWSLPVVQGPDDRPERHTNACTYMLRYGFTR